MAEQVKRTIGAKPGAKIGAKKPTSAPKEEAPAAPEPKAKKGKKLIVMLAAGIAVIGIGAGAAVMVFDSDPAAADEVAEVTPAELGEVVPIEAVSVNLANERYLRLGFALQLSADSGEYPPDASRARDIGIAMFSGRDVAEVRDPANSPQLKDEFLARLQEAFGAETVLDVYYTDFVTQ